MKVGDLVKVIKNDMSLIIKSPGPKDSMFFDQIGTIIKAYQPAVGCLNPWFGVLFPAGYYEVRADAIEVISENR